MKTCIALTALCAAVFLFAACNPGSDSASTDADTNATPAATEETDKPDPTPVTPTTPTTPTTRSNGSIDALD